jgi:beta-phosphoglucomutase
MTIAVKVDIKAVLFDLDGVLIDSMPHHVSAWQEVFRQEGVEVPEMVFRLAEGEKAGLTIRKLAKEHHLDWSDEKLDEMIAKKRRIYRSRAPRGMRPQAKKAVLFCQSQGWKTGIVTGSVQSNLNWMLSEEERSLFDLILSSEYYLNGKPDPEPYLNAARALGVEPEHCLVIENAPLGIRSAKAAGMTCIALTTTLPAEELHEADLIIGDLDEIEPIIHHNVT